MEKRLINQLWRIPLLVTALFTVVYTITFLILGYMPSAERVVLFNKKSYILGNFLMAYQPQLGISRWWDLVIIFISTSILIKIFHLTQEHFSASIIIGELHKPEDRKIMIDKDNITDLQGLKIIICMLSSLFTLAGLLLMLIVEESATNSSKILTIVFFLSVPFYLIFLIIAPIIIKILKSKPVVNLFNWAIDKQPV